MVAGAGHRRVEGGDGSDIVRTQRPARSARHAVCGEAVKAEPPMRSAGVQKPTLASRSSRGAR